MALSTPAAAQGGERWLERAEALAERGRTRPAMAAVRRATRALGPADPRPALALAAMLPDEPVATPDAPLRALAAEVIALADAHLATTSPSAEARRARAWASALLGDHAAAIERASADVGAQDREGSRLLARLATLAVMRDDLASAERSLDAAHRAYPQDPEILSNLGAVELARGDAEGAVGRFRRVVARDPSALEARRDLAGALLAAGRAHEAVTVLERALAVPDAPVELRLELAAATLEAGDLRAAERAARAAIEALPADDGRGHTALGTALARAGRREPARAAYEEALRRDPDDARARDGLAALTAE